MIFKRNLVIVTHFIEYNYFDLVKLFFVKKYYDNNGEEHIIHFMGLPVVFSIQIFSFDKKKFILFEPYL